MYDTCGYNLCDCGSEIVDGICEGCGKIVEDYRWEIDEMLEDYQELGKDYGYEEE